MTYGDWYLPSKDELDLLFKQKDVVGGFHGEYWWYWSSTEVDSYWAWSQNFYTGSQRNFQPKVDYTLKVRAVRAF